MRVLAIDTYGKMIGIKRVLVREPPRFSTIKICERSCTKLLK
jgi:hypothetical protein